MGSSGLEPPTSRLSGARSSLLSYEPISSRTCHLFVSLNSPFGGDDGIRTHDPLLAGQVLSQLSYTPVLFGFRVYSLSEQSLKIEQQSIYSKSSSYLWVFLSVKPFRTVCTFVLPFMLILRGSTVLHRKEVIQPHLPIRLPCYDLTPIIESTFDSCLLAVSALASGVPDFHGLTGGVYKARERIHRSMLTCDY